MKTEKLIICAILIFALTNYAYGMGGHHHRRSLPGGGAAPANSGGNTTTDNSGGNVVTYQHLGQGEGGTFQGAFTGTGCNTEENVIITCQGTPGDPVGAPEPATMLLVGTGLIGLAGYAKKRLKK